MQNNHCIRQQQFLFDDERQQLSTDAREAIHHVLKLRRQVLNDSLKGVLLRHLIWKITVAHKKAKYSTRFRSDGVVRDERLKQEVEHEHVFPIKDMIECLLKAADAEAINSILDVAFACVVTKAEHTKLRRAANHVAPTAADPWVRYREADIAVLDMSTCPPEPVNLQPRR